eukprot:CAMPEP_0113466612 /NCGR_PEP_ID=MMETSP0014_2-20120614/14366_1 /TAXON_ID=2857 /ORGANISM="Nitzschia sp." /LENGTH=436 /DNA_ID=CAMNT_0000358849 /DNA_START=18 /DNA_END=1324 /DNA_ORIENTATION=- /assembly_acc=CAM_ASM_000159
MMLLRSIFLLSGFYSMTTGSVAALTDISAALLQEYDYDDNNVSRTANNNVCTTEEIQSNHPALCRMLTRLESEPEQLSKELTLWARRNGLLVGENLLNTQSGNGETKQGVHTTATASTASSDLPVVFAHGMGDSCFNDGDERIANHTSVLLGNVYSTCIPTGDTQAEDTSNGYFLNMDASVDVFATKVAADPQLKNGFHAIGLSQGNNVIRGYIARYNTPTVHTFLSINGVNAGEGTVPGCFPSSGNDDDSSGHNQDSEQQQPQRLGGICDLLLEQASRRAYSDFAQKHSFQANYWRDPRSEKAEMYYQYSQLARWNNEGPNNNNATYNENWSKTKKFVWVKATEDGMVWPAEGEWWGYPNPKDPFNKPVIPMNETDWYVHDLFGLKTAQEANKNYFEQFVGDHLRFTMEDFDRWVTTYMSAKRDQADIGQKFSDA